MSVGICVIGRNEAAHIGAALDAALAQCERVVFVDSGSTDNSVSIARQRSVDIVELDDSQPMSASRARNAGFNRLIERHAGISAVQFVDGDCVLADGWIDAASRELGKSEDSGVVFGQLSEKHPNASVYNRLCEIEWYTPPGDCDACGGIFMVRADAFKDLGGFDTTVIAGEEPELCLRLRRSGRKIVCIGRPMAIHDAGLDRFGLWWGRMMRAGRAYAASADLHGKSADRFGVRETASAIVFGGALPLAVVILAILIGPPALIVLAIYPLHALRIALNHRDPPRPLVRRLELGFFTVLGKFAEFAGQVHYWSRRVFRR